MGPNSSGRLRWTDCFDYPGIFANVFALGQLAGVARVRT